MNSTVQDEEQSDAVPQHCWHETGFGHSFGFAETRREVACCHCGQRAWQRHELRAPAPPPGHGRFYVNSSASRVSVALPVRHNVACTRDPAIVIAAADVQADGLHVTVTEHGGKA